MIDNDCIYQQNMETERIKRTPNLLFQHLQKASTFKHKERLKNENIAKQISPLVQHLQHAYTLRKAESKLQQTKKCKIDIIKKSNLPIGTPPLLSANEEDIIINKIRLERNNGNIVTGRIIRNWALGFKRRCFKASRGWFQKFKKRHGLTIRTGNRKRKPIPISILQSNIQRYWKEIAELRLKHNIPKCNIINFDEGKILFDESSNKTVDWIGTQDVIIVKKENYRSATIAITVGADGSKYQPLVLFKGKKQQSMPFPHRTFVIFRNSTWLNTTIYKEYLSRIVIPNIPNKQSPTILIHDSFKPHLKDEITTLLNEHNIHTVVVPSGCTGMVQPIDATLLQSMKRYIRSQCEEKLLAIGDRHVTALEWRQMLVKNVDEAFWSVLQKDQIIRSFKRTGCSVALDGSEDAMISLDSMRHFRPDRSSIMERPLCNDISDNENDNKSNKDQEDNNENKYALKESKLMNEKKVEDVNTSSDSETESDYDQPRSSKHGSRNVSRRESSNRMYKGRRGRGKRGGIRRTRGRKTGRQSKPKNGKNNSDNDEY